MMMIKLALHKMVSRRNVLGAPTPAGAACPHLHREGPWKAGCTVEVCRPHNLIICTLIAVASTTSWQAHRLGAAYIGVLVVNPRPDCMQLPHTPDRSTCTAQVVLDAR
jgi:hypothetical protein